MLKKIIFLAVLLTAGLCSSDEPNSFGISTNWPGSAKFPYATINFRQGYDQLIFGTRKAKMIEFQGYYGCYEIETGKFSQWQKSLDIADTRFFLARTDSKGNGYWASLDDDGGDGYFSKARIFFNNASVTGSKDVLGIIAVTGYDDYINTKAFGLNISYIGNDFQACNNGLPLASINVSNSSDYMMLYNAN